MKEALRRIEAQLEVDDLIQQIIQIKMSRMGFTRAQAVESLNGTSPKRTNEDLALEETLRAAIAQKMEAGLTRQQAIEVIGRNGVQ